MKYIKISAWVPFEGSINKNGLIRFSDKMRNQIYDREEYFREKLIVEINELTNEKWHITFTEFVKDYFDAEVYTENENDFITIKSILESKFRKNQLQTISKHTFREKLFNKELVSNVISQIQRIN